MTTMNWGRAKLSTPVHPMNVKHRSRRKTQPIGAVYVLGHQTNHKPQPPFKVGFTAYDGGVPARLRDCQVGSPKKLCIALTVKTKFPKIIEALVHLALKKHALSGEWFNAPLHHIERCIERAIHYEQNPIYGIPRVAPEAQKLIERLISERYQTSVDEWFRLID